MVSMLNISFDCKHPEEFTHQCDILALKKNKPEQNIAPSALNYTSFF